MSRISDEVLDKIPEEEEESPVFKELPGAKGTDEAVVPLTGGGDRSTRDSSGELSNQANGGTVLPNGRVYGECGARPSNEGVSDLLSTPHPPPPAPVL